MPEPSEVRWWANQDSNLGPTGYEPVALPTELLARCSEAQFHYPAISGGVNRFLLCADPTQRREISTMPPSTQPQPANCGQPTGSPSTSTDKTRADTGMMAVNTPAVDAGTFVIPANQNR